jgi:folate-dependent phosphoribosylglycinamide formyltransferase PurN
MEKIKPYVLVFASGTKTGGGTGFETLVRAARTTPPILDAWISGVITNHADGGVWQKAQALGIPAAYWAGPLRPGATGTWLNISTPITSCSPAG